MQSCFSGSHNYAGVDLRQLPVEQRKRTLAGLVRGPNLRIAINEHFISDGDIIYRQACKLGYCRKQ